MDNLAPTFIASHLIDKWRDPRLAQILFLGLLLGTGAWLRDFSIQPMQVAFTFLCGLGCQNFCERLTRRPTRSLRSAIITSFGVTLLLRSNAWWIHPIAVTAAMASKFALRVRGKHLFNPANFGVLFALAMLPGRVDIGRAMGPGRGVGRMDGRDGQHRHPPRAPGRHQLDVPGFLRRARWRCALSGWGSDGPCWRIS